MQGSGKYCSETHMYTYAMILEMHSVARPFQGNLIASVINYGKRILGIMVCFPMKQLPYQKLKLVSEEGPALHFQMIENIRLLINHV